MIFMLELPFQDLNNDEAEAEEKGDKAVDDEAEKMIAEAEDRVAKAWMPSDIKLEIVDGEKEGSRWLIVDDTHICYQNNVKGKKRREQEVEGGQHKVGML